MTSGARNLAILGIGAILITTLTTGVSLFIYRQTGDIYLDRSRPGYLPDEEEVLQESETNTNYTYSDTGALDQAELDEYLKNLQVLIDRLDDYADAYSASPLSDESLGIPSADATSPAESTTN